MLFVSCAACVLLLPLSFWLAGRFVCDRGAGCTPDNMKLNLSNPRTGMSKMIEVDDDKKLLPFFDRRMATEIVGDSMGDEFAGCIFRIDGSNDKQGFPMKQAFCATTVCACCSRRVCPASVSAARDRGSARACEDASSALTWPL